MKQLQLLILLTLSITCIFSCKDANPDTGTQSEMIGDWKLIETLQDPGDGSGVFEATDSDLTLTISSDNVVKANGILCGLQESDTMLTGQFDKVESIITATCDGGELRHSVVLDEQQLIISNLSCREPCRAKLRKI